MILDRTSFIIFNMHQYINEYPPASRNREQEAKIIFPYQSISPQEYYDRYREQWSCFSFDDYIYEDEILNEWIHSLGDLLFVGNV